MAKAKPRKRIGILPIITGRAKTISFRGKRYYYLTDTFTLKGAKDLARRAMAKGFKVRLVRDPFRVGAMVYTNPKVRAGSELREKSQRS